MENLRRSLKTGGHFIIATFTEDGALKCSRLEVERYDLKKIRETIGKEFKLARSFREEHHTPFGTTQNFLYAHFQFEK